MFSIQVRPKLPIDRAVDRRMSRIIIGNNGRLWPRLGCCLKQSNEPLLLHIGEQIAVCLSDFDHRRQRPFLQRVQYARVPTRGTAGELLLRQFRQVTVFLFKSVQ